MDWGGKTHILRLVGEGGGEFGRDFLEMTKSNLSI